MAVSDLQIEKFQVWEWLHTGDWSFYVYWKMFQPYDWADLFRSSWSWDEVYALNETSDFNLSWFQQWNEVFGWMILVSNQSSSSITCEFTVYLDQYVWWSWWTPDTSTLYRYETIKWKTDTDTWANALAFWMWVDPDEIRPWISQYRLRLYAESTLLATKILNVSNLDFDTTVCNAWYLWVEWSNLCYVPPCYYSWSSDTWYKHKIQYDTGYAWATWQTPWMIWIPDDSSDHHIYYTTRNWTVLRTKESYARVPTASTSSSRRWHIWLTPSTSYSTEETGYNYICYIDYSWVKRRLWTWEVD